MSEDQRNPEGSLAVSSEVGSLSRSPPAGHPEEPRATEKPTMAAMTEGVPREFFSEIVNMMRSMSERLTTQPQPRVKITEIFLPSYDPDGNIGVREWCDHITTAVSTYSLSDYDVRMKVSSLLKGRAKLWADEWLVTTSTWEELRQNIIITFEPEHRYSRDVLMFREHVYDASKDLAEFLSRSWLLWKRVTKDKLNNGDAVEAVIGSVGDPRLRIELMNARATSVPELISVASSIRPKRAHQPLGNNNNLPLAKRPRSDKDVPICSYCKKVGHLVDVCRNKVRESYISRNTTISDRSHGNLPTNTCTFCSKSGHTFDICYKRLKSISPNISTVTSDKDSKRVNNIVSSEITCMYIQIGDSRLFATFDSGAECCIMREKIANKLPGRRRDEVNYLRGIGSFPVVSVSSINCVCIIDSIHVELQFLILPNHEVSTDILIGTNLLKETGLSVLVSSSGARLVYQPCIMHLKANYSIFDNIDHDLHDLTQIEQLHMLLNKYSHLFIQGYPKSRVNTGYLEIRLKNPDKYVERRPYRLSPSERNKVREIIQELLDNNIIRESQSPFSSPIILVKKKNGADRMCVDYRELNANTVRDHYPLPLIADQIDNLSGGKYFNIFDMAAGFHQILISESSVEKTAFVTPDGLYEYVTMPFGLCNAPSVYQRCINRALGTLLNAGSAGTSTSVPNDSVAQVYIDDVISESRNFEDGLVFMERILISLEKSGFSINIDKCLFFKKSVEYLGNIITDGNIRPSPRKVDALVKAPVPTSVKQVRQFAGLAGYFRRFIPNFARIMIPLYELTKTGAKWQWTHRQEEARDKIIQYLVSTPVLMIFREDAPIELYTDASSLGVGGILVQVADGRQHAVAYFSMRTTDAESRYHSYELETLAVVRAIKHFRHFLYGRHFKVITDCNALKASKHKQELLPRVYRWWAFLQNFDFEIEYRRGDRMQHADFFSRNVENYTVNIMTRDLQWLKIEQRRDDSLRSKIDAVLQGETINGFLIEEDLLKYKQNDEVLGEQKLVVVPKSFQWSLINTYHTSLKHPGWEKTLAKIKETYWFDKMNTTTRQFVENCIVCKTSKNTSGSIQAQLHPIPKPSVPFEMIHMDITGKLGTPSDQEYVIVTVDAYTKYVLLHHANDKSQHSSLAALKQVIHLFGTPKLIVIDGGREFLGEYKNYCERYGIEIHSIAPGVSRANGQVERVMGTLKNALTMIKNYETVDWHTALDSLQLALNCTRHQTTGVAPLTLLTRRQHCVPPELLNLVQFDEMTIDFDALEQHVQHRMTEAATKEKQRFDARKAKIRRFQRGEFVLVKNNPRNQTSLDLKFSAPYEIYKVLDNDRYLIKPVVGRGRPKKVAHDQLRRAPQPGELLTVSPALDLPADIPPKEVQDVDSQPGDDCLNSSTHEDYKLKDNY